MHKKLIVANWKMNPNTLQEARKIFHAIKRQAERLIEVETVICPPFIFLQGLRQLSPTRRCVLGAQDVFWENSLIGDRVMSGAYTGEISPRMLRISGVRYVIVGHSERRAFCETDEIVSRKMHAALAEGIRPILCVGESERDKEGEYLHFIKKEIKNSLAGIPRKYLSQIVIAYEPIWAVGPKAERADTPDELFEMVILIRKIIGELFGRKIATMTPILYGGSVNETNAGEFLKKVGVAGLLVGRASLSHRVFGGILKTANRL